MRLTKLLRGLDGFADDKWVSAGGAVLGCFTASLRAGGRECRGSCRSAGLPGP
jgi:hypothetical protein